MPNQYQLLCDEHIIFAKAERLFEKANSMIVSHFQQTYKGGITEV